MRRWLTWALAAVGFIVHVVIIVTLLPAVFLPGMAVLNMFPRSGGPPVPIATADFSGTGPGSLVTATTMPGVTRTVAGRGLTAARVLYRSTNGDTGEPTVVSGSVFVPPGKPPAGGWPIATFAHGTVGIEGPCAPSLSDTLLGAIAAVRPLADRGYAVAVPDYQGLGVKGVHPYLDSRTAGLNVIDAVRALRHTFADISHRWAVIGHSQGGGAAWSANEQAKTYAPELDLVGAVAAAPAADVSGMVNKAQNGTMTPDQRAAMQLIIESLARFDPSLDRDDYRQGAAKQYWNVLSACTGPQVYQRGAAAEQLGQRDFVPRTQQAADRLAEVLTRWALPQRPLTAPLYVAFAGADTYIDAQWTKDAIARACALGGSVTISFEPDKGHSDVDISNLFTWVRERFAGKPAVNDC